MRERNCSFPLGFNYTPDLVYPFTDTDVEPGEVSLGLMGILVG